MYYFVKFQPDSDSSFYPISSLELIYFLPFIMVLACQIWYGFLQFLFPFLHAHINPESVGECLPNLKLL